MKLSPVKGWNRWRSRPFSPWLLETGPLACAIACLWGKMMCFSLALRSVWWAPEVSLVNWVCSHPIILTATLSALMLLFGLSALLPRVWRFVTVLSLDLLLTALILADTIHVNYYGDVTSAASLLNLQMLPAVMPSVIAQVKPVYGLYFLDIMVGIIVLPRYLRACQTIRPLNHKHIMCLCGGMIVSGLLLAVPAARLAWKDPNGVFAYANLQRDVCATIGLLPYHLADGMIHLASGRQVVGVSERQRVARFLDENGKQRGASSSLFGVAHRKNLILISAESLQAFPIGLEIHGQPVAPRLSAFAKESLNFANFYDQTHLGTTSDAEFAALQSLHPLPVGVVVERYAANEYFGLPAILSEQGYATLSAVGAPGSFWNMKDMHARLGFEQSFFEDNYRIVERIGAWLADREFLDQTVPILKAQREPFLAYLLSSSNHDPFDLPRRYRVLKLGDLEGTPLGNYLHSVHYFDQAFGEFVDRLRENGLLDRSIVALYGDHQAFLKNLPELARLLGFPEQSRYLHLLVLKKVPFMIRLPHGEGAKILKTTGGHLDIAPTLLSLLGITEDRTVMLGNDLTRDVDSLVIFRDGSFADGKHYFINRFGPVSNSSCYEAATGRAVDCRALAEQRQEALNRLRISDLILQGDLIPALRGSAGLARLRDRYYPGTSRGYLNEEDTRRAKWQLLVREGNVASLEFPRDDPEMVRIAITEAKTTISWHIQLNQPRLSVNKNHHYAISFRGRADRSRRIYFAVARAHGRWDNLGLYRDAELTTEWKSFQADFTATADDDNARVHFDLGGNDAPVELTAVTLRSLPDGKLIEPPPLAPLSFARQLQNRFVVIGHRGDPSEAPENTLRAINQAFAIGAAMVEVDVHLSRDGIPVIIHDETLERTTNGKGMVSHMTVAQLKALDAGSWKSPKYARERIPTLAETLQAAKGKGPLLLDLNVEGMGRAVAQVLRNLNLPQSSVVIGAWTAAQASDFRRYLPQVQILMPTLEGFSKWESDFFTKHIARGITGFELGANWSPAFVAAAHAHGMPVYAFTINDEATMRKLIEMGINGIETDYPGMLLRLINQIRKR